MKLEKIPNITKLATTTTTTTTTTTALTAVENKTKSKKDDYNTKISKTENNITADHDHVKYFTTQDFNKLTSENFTARLKQANIARKNDVAYFVKKVDFGNTLKHVALIKNELNELSKNILALSIEGSTKDLINKFSILNGEKYFSS